MRHAIAIVIFLAAQAAHAQFKCTGTDGRTTFQQTPCEVRQRQEAVLLRDAGQPAAPAPGQRATNAVARPAESPYFRLNDMLVRERRTIELEREIQATESAIDYRNGQLNVEIAALRSKKQYARNNLAGATWEQSISTEMQAVTMKHKIQNDNDHERLKKMRRDLEAVKKEPGK